MIPPAASSNPKGRLLIIDDEEGIRESLQMILENEGYKVFTADSGESGIKEFENKYFTNKLNDNSQ